jgi:cytochrome c2
METPGMETPGMEATMRRTGWKRVLFSWRTLVVLALWGASLVAAGAAGGVAYRSRARIRAFLAGGGGPLIETNLYQLSVRKVPVPAEGREGGIAPLGDGILFANRLGRTWFVDGDLTLRELGLRVPTNFEEFEADPYNVNTNLRNQFGVKDLMIQTRAEGLRVLASVNYWDSDRDCYAVRVSSLETSVEEVLSGAPETKATWKTVFETTPCMPLTQNPDGVHRNPTNGAGGRLAPISDHEVLLTVGGFGPQTPVNPNNSFGKTILIDLAAGTSRTYSSGHRNPQGLAVSSSGDVWLTEHGDRGGDELNSIRDGMHYGFPFVSYGTEYESMVWSNNPHQGRHEGYERPMHAWVPSIGISQAVVIEKDLFEHWQGDIMVSSLGTRSLYRVRVEEGRVIFVEPIFIEHRIRDIAEASDGTLVLKGDDDVLVFLRPFDRSSADLAALDAPTRGRLLASGCMGCHSVTSDGLDGIGPSLWGVVGRRVASREGYTYSEALRDLDGRWSSELLARFLENPNDVAPGTTMSTTASYDEAEIADLISYLETLQ